jgi:hypothetical protein
MAGPNNPPAGNTPEQEAKSEAAKMDKTVHTGNDHSVETTYHTFKDDFNAWAKGKTPEEIGKYWAEFSKDVNPDLLNNLALAYATDKDTVAHNSSDGYGYTKYELNNVSRFNDSTPADRMLASQLVKNFDQLSPTFAAGYGRPTEINAAYLGQKLSDADDQYKAEGITIHQHEQNQQLIGKIMGNDGNPDHSLFHALTTQVTDGKISNKDNFTLDDLKRYQQEYQLRQSEGSLGGAYTKENLDTVNNLVQNWDSDAVKAIRGEHRTAWKLWLGKNPNDSISMDSMRSAAGYEKNDDVFGHFKTTDASTPGGNKGQLDTATADHLLSTLITTPAAIENTLAGGTDANPVTHATSISHAGLQRVINDQNAMASLTVEQRNSLNDLNTNWAKYANGAESLKTDDLVAAAGGPQAYMNYLQSRRTEASNLAANLAKTSSDGLLDDSGAISKDKLNQKLGQLGSPPTSTDPEVASLISLSNNFDAISHNGQTISAKELADYERNWNAKGYSGDATHLGFKGSDTAATQASDQFAAMLKQFGTNDQGQAIETLGKAKDGEHLYDLAQKTLAARAKLTGEPVDGDAIMREVNRIMVLNGYPAAHLDGKTHITDKNLPKAWANVKANQQFKIYSDDDVARFQQLIAKANAAKGPNPAAPVNPEGQPTGWYTYTGDLDPT